MPDPTQNSYSNPLIPNSWPVDFDDNQIANGSDTLTFAPVFGGISPNPPYDSRWDLNNDGKINGSDLLMLAPFLGKNCASVMNSFTPPAPTPTTSRYMSTITNGDQEGCNDGTTGLAGTVIFDWGHPYYDSTRGFGTIDYSQTFRAANPDILGAIDDYIRGYWRCTPINGPHITVVVGADNDFLTNQYGGHGQAWGFLINAVNAYIDVSGYRSQVDAIGGLDAEPSFDTATNTLSWASSYLSTTPFTYYDFGSLDGCHTTWTGDVSSMGSFLCATPDWTEANFAQIAWRNGIRPLFPYPEVYRRDGWNAAQWQALSVYTFASGEGAMTFPGELTQVRACNYDASIYQPDPKCTTRTTDNPPGNGWQQLWWLLNRDSVTAFGLRATSSDITYLN